MTSATMGTKGTRFFATARAQEMKLRFLLAAAEGDGCLASLLAMADWMEENGGYRQAEATRADAVKHATGPGRTLAGETWLAWWARYQLKLIADGLAKSDTAFPRFGYHGNWNHDGTPEAADGSMEFHLRRGWVPTLCRRGKRQVRLGRIIEGLGYRVFWIG